MVIAVDSAKGDVGAHAFLFFLVFFFVGGLVFFVFFFFFFFALCYLLALETHINAIIVETAACGKVWLCFEL